MHPVLEVERVAGLPGLARRVHPDGDPVERAAHRHSEHRRLRHAAAVAAALANATFNAFSAALEGIHNSGHVWVGGSMGSIPTAPCDPVFWMHHAEIDRIWAVWQAANPGLHPPLAGTAAVMDPWPETETDTRDITALGYAYV